LILNHIAAVNYATILYYVPVVVVFFAYGALGLIDVTRDLWIKESLSFTPHNSRGLASGSHCLGP
jgi:hypothetical protein